ncbi:MAG: GNAT family protein [Pseudomonadota bacterium]
MSSIHALQSNVYVRRPQLHDETDFLAMTYASRILHSPWVSPPLTKKQFEIYFHSRNQTSEDAFFLFHQNSHQLIGVINLSLITRGLLDNAYLSYYVHIDYSGQGYMTEGLLQVIDIVFNHMHLHRLEANIQPHNLSSKKMVKRCGFRYEGFSPKLINVQGIWRDHERWALLNDNY